MMGDAQIGKFWVKRAEVTTSQWNYLYSPFPLHVLRLLMTERHPFRPFERLDI